MTRELLVLMPADDGRCDQDRCKRVAKWAVRGYPRDSEPVLLACTIHLAALCTELVTLNG